MTSPSCVEVAGGHANAGIQGESIAANAFELEADPVVEGAAFGTQDHGLTGKIFNDGLEMAVVEEIADGHAAADLRNLDRIAGRLADVFKGAVALVEQEQFRLAIPGPFGDLVDLRIDMAVDQKNVLPAVVGKIDESVAPADVATGGSGDA